MKKLIIAAMLVITAAGFSQPQDGSGKQRRAEKLTPEQRNQLQLKKMTLDLSLNESQQKEMAKIIAEQSEKRDAMMADRKANKDKGVKPTSDERFAKENQMLDDRIAMKARVKKILNSEQFEKWEKNNDEKKTSMQRRMHKGRGNMHNDGSE